MLTRPQIEQFCQRALALSTAPATEIRVLDEHSALTRLANNEVSQSVAKDRTDLCVRVLLGSADRPTRVGVATTNRMDDAGLRRAVEQALQLAQAQHESPDLLAPLGPQDYSPGGGFDEHTANCPAAARTAPLAELLARCRADGLQCAGAFATAGRSLAIATSAGLFAFDRKSSAKLSVTVAGQDVSGWSQQLATSVAEIDAARLGGEALDIARRAVRPTRLDPGRYTVVLPPEAVADLLLFLLGGLASKAIVEGRSFFSGKLGQKLFAPTVSIIDDAYHPLAGGLPFDDEGLPRQRVAIVENGIFANMVHGRETAKLAGEQPTGHGLPAPTAEGAMPGNLMIAPGDSSLQEMIASVERGLLVTHFHYTNMLRPVDLTITGMTRDGLFLIENGKVGPPVNNMRFTESLAHAFGSVRTIGRELAAVPGRGVGNFVAPPLLIDGFNFSSSTEF